LGTVINAENYQRILIVDFDAVHDDIGQPWYHHFERSRERAFMAHMGKADQEAGCFSNSRADVPCGLRISLSDMVSDRGEMPERPAA
jgi:hypothetical protein